MPRASRSFALIAAFAVITSSGLAVKPYSAHACSCMAPEPPRESLQASAAVFQGTAVKVASEGDAGYIVTFNNDTVWKGSVDDVATVRTARDSAACGFAFEEGKKYVVYAYEDEGNGLATGLCSRTHELAINDPDVTELGRGTAIASATTTPEVQGRSLARNLVTIGIGALAILAAVALRAYRAPKPPVA